MHAAYETALLPKLPAVAPENSRLPFVPGDYPSFVFKSK